ncbi:MAG: zinc ribbon domain-containing protein [Chloroflexi bacterium]|nr:zinc ribbon domain-containing protein [Chloroflexota bacterium]
MPLYEYVCKDCQARFEVRRSMKEIDSPTACPECHGDHVARQISQVLAFSHGDGGSVSTLGGGGGCSSCGGGTCSSCGGSTQN